jgi:hypothetical protein
MDSTIDKLERLAALHRAGALTDPEYTGQKARLLAVDPASVQAPAAAATSASGSVEEFIASDALDVLLGKSARKLRPRFLAIAEKANVASLPLTDQQAQIRPLSTGSWNWMAVLFSYFWGVYWGTPEAWIVVAAWCAETLAEPFVPGLGKAAVAGGFGFGFAYARYCNGWLLASLIKDQARGVAIARRGSWKRVIIAVLCVLGAAAVAYALEPHA